MAKTNAQRGTGWTQSKGHKGIIEVRVWRDNLIEKIRQILPDLIRLGAIKIADAQDKLVLRLDKGNHAAKQKLFAALCNA